MTTTADTPKTDEEIAADLASSARHERGLMRDQSRAERRLVKAARRSKDAEERLSRARAKVARAESVATERKAVLDAAVAAVSAARAARESGERVGAGPEERDLH